MFRDLCCSSIPFGGKLIVLAGDFRQTLPITPRAHAAEVLENCINRSFLWQYVTNLTLSENVRADPDQIVFKNWLLTLGNGTLRSSSPDVDTTMIDIPSECHLSQNIVESIYPDFNDRLNSVIITPLNTDADKVNKRVLLTYNPDIAPISYFSVDTIIEDEENEVNNISVEFLNSLTPSGMPEHNLQLKVGVPIILIRNIDQKKGLCNGTRLIVLGLGVRSIHAEIISGSNDFLGNRVFLPRIKLCPSDLTVPFKFERIQFPIKLAFCLTINKSQGQEFDEVGIFLPKPVFSHGQLYVAFSRAKRFSSLHIEISDTSHQYCNYVTGIARTRNVVFSI